MSFTLPTDYGNRARIGNIIENWIVQLGYDDFPDTSTDFLGIAVHPVTIDSVYYRGVIDKTPSIRYSLDLAKSTAKTGNVTLVLSNDNYQGGDLSKEFLGGTRKYINRPLKIWSVMPGATALTDCLQVGQMRLIDITHDSGTITLSCVEQRPWDFISIPNVLSTLNKYFPVAYGNFKKNTSTSTTPRLCNDTVTGQGGFKLFPTPVNEVSGDIMCLAHDSITTNAALHYYEPNIDAFIPLDPVDNASESYQGGNTIRAEVSLKRSFRFKPTGTDPSSDFSSVENSYDIVSGEPNTGYESTTSATDTISHTVVPSTTPSTTTYLIVTLPQIVGDFSLIKVAVKYSISETLGEATSQSTSLTMDNLDGSGTTALVTETLTADLIAQYNANNGLPSTLTLNFTHGCTYDASADPFGTEASATCTIHDIQILGTVELDYGAGYEASIKAVADIKELYTGADGLTESWSGSSNPITEIHEAHRDMLIRYAGYTTDTPYNWSSNLNIDSFKNWGIRWWALKPVKLKKVLEQFQYEGGFIFKWRADGTGSYWCVKDSYSDGDEAAILTGDDVDKVRIYNTPFSELLTKMNVNYEKHPAEDKYVTSVSPYGDTSRTAWDIQTKENIAEVNLDAYVSPVIDAYDNSTDVDSASANDDFFAYYYNIFGDIRIMVDCEIINPKHYNLETGDIVKFDSMIVDPFNYDWNELSSGTEIFFMITSLTRSVGLMKITCREVGRNTT